MKVIEVSTAKEFASTFFGDPILKMAVNALMDHVPAVEAEVVVRCKECIADGGCSRQIDMGMGGEGYCSKGERKA